VREPGGVENSKPKPPPSPPDFLRLVALCREVGRLNRPNDGEDRRNRKLLKDWVIERGRSPTEIESAIRGARLLADTGKCWLKRGEAFELRALERTATLADQGDGKALRPLYDVAVEAWVKHEEVGNRGRSPPSDGPTRIDVRVGG
jgi:hypothetical protein